jgi:DNA-binding CsgD family transcriptional regulator
MLAIRQANDAGVLRIARTVTLLDAVCSILFIAGFTDFPGGAQSALYVPIMIEAVAYEGTEGAAASLAVFIAGVLGISAARVAFWHQAFAWTTVVSWSLILAVIALSLAIFDQVTAGAAMVPERLLRAPARGSTGEAPVRLSPRELEVLRLIAEGNSNAMIAQRLHLSETTVKTYVETLLLRLDARTRAEAVAAASRLNLI